MMVVNDDDDDGRGQSRAEQSVVVLGNEPA
jgi:hypothetical protein